MQRLSEQTHLDGPTRTLLLPLWARAKESLKQNPIIADPRAGQIVASLSAVEAFKNCFEDMDRNLDRYYQLSQVIRARCLDEEIRTFLRAHLRATIVNIGAGFDTTFARVDNGTLTWYDLDLPEVIALRRQYLPETESSHCLARSVLDPSWFGDIGQPRKDLLFVACGVFFFFDVSEVKQLFAEMAARFPGSEIVFDTISRFFLIVGNWAVLKRSGMDGKATMRWGITSARDIEKWNPHIRVVDEYPLYARVPLDPSWGKNAIKTMTRANRMRGLSIFHLRFEPSNGA